ncbi:EamA family transporter [Nocardioides sp. TF02-7]|uniref:EamA family transporter n=1 Tax=Nocardioides sp. TF02-7 TaxID=2917724 RepID=UPI001F067C94|nr:EamA family transporter [Nocardioides sp. TF02-7]UMG92992.1 EamA family transporter [Nocardioides sp. TF02-7]
MKRRYTKCGTIVRWNFMVVECRLVLVTRRDSLLAALVATVWGVNFVVIDWGMGDVPPLLFVAIRFTVVLLPAVFLLPRPDVPWRVLLAVGAFMSLGQFSFLYLSMAAGMPPGLAGLVLQAQVVLTIVLAAAALRERPTAAQTVGVALGAAGLVVVGLGRGGHVPATALLLCLLAALTWAIGNVVSRASGATGGLALTVWSALVVPVPLALLSLAVDGPAAFGDAAAAFGWEALLSTLYTAVLASLVGYGIFNGLLSRNPSAAVVPWILLVPPVAMGSAWLLLGERPAAGEVAGGAVLVLGVLVALRPSAPRLGVGRTAAPEVGDRGTDPAGGEVGGPRLDLVERAERR